jgi:hypothetical protein
MVSETKTDCAGEASINLPDREISSFKNFLFINYK